jgi:hypothetical protein
MAWWSTIELKSAAPVEVSSLSFDRENPRYSAEKGLPHRTDQDIVTYLDKTSDLAELVQSIATSGYVDIEPLIAFGHKDDLIVLEGNRRLAALKVLLDHQFASKCGVTVPPIGVGNEKSFKSVLVYRVADRSEARDFIGFKHINGPHRWDSIAKAKFAADWLRDEQKKKTGLTLRDIANRMGDRHSTLQRMVQGLFALEQAEEEEVFSRFERFQGRQFAFSHLYVALTRSGYRDFLGLKSENEAADPKKNPVPKTHLVQLGQVLNWLYGSQQEQQRPVIESQNPDIKNLGEVLENPKSRKIMLETRKLEAAYAEVFPPQKQFERHIVELHSLSGMAVTTMRAYDGNDVTLLELAKEVHQNTEILYGHMQRANSKVGK